MNKIANLLNKLKINLSLLKDKNKTIPLAVGVAIFSFMIVFYIFAQWTEPSQGPPGGNVPAPLTVGGGTETKTGGLNVMGDVGIGTDSPEAKLQVGDGASIASIKVPNGGMCIDTDGACSAPAGVLRVGPGGIYVSDSANNILSIRSEEIYAPLYNTCDPNIRLETYWTDCGSGEDLWFNLVNTNGWFKFDDRVRIHEDLDVYGSKNFVDDHPIDPTKEIVYSTLEGPEAGTYVRGTGQLRDGVARIELPEHFAMVTSEEVPVTVLITPQDDSNGMYVAEASVHEIMIRENKGGTSDAGFYYHVYGVREGYEDHEVIRDKE